MNETMLPLDKKKILNKPIDAQEFKSIISDEKRLQKECEDWLAENGVFYIHIPDAVYRFLFDQRCHVPLWARRMASDAIKGIPDFIIFEKGEKYNRTLCVELKTAKGKLSQGQKNFAKRVNVVVVRSFEDFVKCVEEFLDG